MNRLLAGVELGAGHGVRLGVVPLVELDTGIVGAVETGDLNSGAEGSSARGLDVQLEALNVELGLATREGSVDVFNAVGVITYT